MPRRREPALPAWEQAACWGVGVAGVLYGIYNLYLTSRGMRGKLIHLGEGLEVLGRTQDVADGEWVVFSTFLCRRLPPFVLLHVLLSAAMTRLRVRGKTRAVTFAMVGAAAMCSVMSWRFLVLLVATPLPFHLASMSATMSSLVAVWAVGIAFIHLINNNMHLDYLVDELLGATDYLESFVVVYVWSSAVIRCTCLGVERVWCLKQLAFAASLQQPHQQPSSVTRTVIKKDLDCSSPSRTSALSRRKPNGGHCDNSKQTSSSSFDPKESACDTDSKVKDATQLYDWPVLSTLPSYLDSVLYVLYLPLLLVGPPIPFKDFIEQMENPVPLSRDRLMGVLWGTLRVGFWFCFNIVMLHFLFFNALGADANVMQSTNKWTLATTAYLIGQFMTNKYVVIFGAMRQIAKLDGLDLAENPICISYVYAYSDMWKYFDRGLHSCIKRYIFIPLGGSRAGLVRGEVATLAAFSYLGYWHGGGQRHLAWTLLNFLNTNLGLMAARLEATSLVQKHLVCRLSGVAMRRVRCALHYPNWLLATTSSMIFLVDPHFALIYATRIALQWDSFLSYGVVVYCLTQNSKHLQNLGCAKFS